MAGSFTRSKNFIFLIIDNETCISSCPRCVPLSLTFPRRSTLAPGAITCSVASSALSICLMLVSLSFSIRKRFLARHLVGSSLGLAGLPLPRHNQRGQLRSVQGESDHHHDRVARRFGRVAEERSHRSCTLGRLQRGDVFFCFFCSVGVISAEEQTRFLLALPEISTLLLHVRSCLVCTSGVDRIS